MNNQYYEYLSLLEMKGEYQNIIRDIIDAEGEFTEEIKNKVLLLEEDRRETIFRIYNIIKELKGEQVKREKEIERLTNKNKIDERSVLGWRKMLIELVKVDGLNNSSGNPNIKVNDLSFTVSKSKSIQVDDDFEDERFVTWELKQAVPTIYKDRINNFLKSKLSLHEDAKFVKKVDKDAIKREIDSGVLVKGADIEETEKLIIRE